MIIRFVAAAEKKEWKFLWMYRDDHLPKKKKKTKKRDLDEDRGKM